MASADQSNNYGRRTSRSPPRLPPSCESNPLAASSPFIELQRSENHRPNDSNLVEPSEYLTLSNNDSIPRKRKRDDSNLSNDTAELDDHALEAPKRLSLKRKKKIDIIEEFKAFRETRAHVRSPTPTMDDYPVPAIDDMILPIEFQTYTRKRSGKATSQTPSEYEKGRQEFYRLREERRLKDDLEMFNGLKNFKGSQRGWDGRPEPERMKPSFLHTLKHELTAIFRSYVGTEASRGSSCRTDADQPISFRPQRSKTNHSQGA